MFLISIECLLRSIPNDYSYKRNYLDLNSDKIEVLFLGNSHASYDINPAYIRFKSFNNSFGCQTIDYDYSAVVIKKRQSYDWSISDYS